MDKEKKFYQPPEEMPGGFWDVLQPLATWILRALKDAYQNGYMRARLMLPAHGLPSSTRRSRPRARLLSPCKPLAVTSGHCCFFGPASLMLASDAELLTASSRGALLLVC